MAFQLGASGRRRWKVAGEQLLRLEGSWSPKLYTFSSLRNQKVDDESPGRIDATVENCANTRSVRSI